jgi:hypothetical protein
MLKMRCRLEIGLIAELGKLRHLEGRADYEHVLLAGL